MNDKKLNKLFDIDAAVIAYKSFQPHLTRERMIEEILKAATAGREYQLVPEVRDWDGVEPLDVGHKITHNNGNQYVVIDIANGESKQPTRYPVTIVYQNVDNGTTWSQPLSDVKRNFKPKPKKINHSSLVGSGIDCITVGDEEIADYLEEVTDIKSIRMNHPMALTEKQIKAIPEGYQKWGLCCDTGYWVEFDECGLGDKLFTIVKVSIADDWKL